MFPTDPPFLPRRDNLRSAVTLVSLEAVFWMSRGALRDIQKTAARETTVARNLKSSLHEEQTSDK